jgi:hypothetical protein
MSSSQVNNSCWTAGGTSCDLWLLVEFFTELVLLVTFFEDDILPLFLSVPATLLNQILPKKLVGDYEHSAT